MRTIELFRPIQEEVTVKVRRLETATPWHLPPNTDIARSEAYKFLCQQRGRKFHDSLLSKWTADLGIKKGASHFSSDQFVLLQRLNLHYASGGKREEILSQFESEGVI